MFQKGNKLGAKGRPKVVLTKPELLLPAVFIQHQVNWQKDLVKLYRIMRIRELTLPERSHLNLLKELLPYMVTKVALKDFDKPTGSTPNGSAGMAKATSELLQALENERNGPKSDTQSSGS